MIIQNLSFKKWNEDSYEACLNSSSVPKYNCAIARELPFSSCRVTYSCQSEAFSLQNLFRWRILLVHHLSTTILHLMTSLCRGIPTSVWQLLFWCTGELTNHRHLMHVSFSLSWPHSSTGAEVTLFHIAAHTGLCLQT